MWCEFTKNNYPLLSKKNLVKNDFLINEMRKERSIISKLPLVEYKISDYKIPYELIFELSSTPWVYKKGIVNNIDELNVDIKISWDNNTIYLKTTINKYNKIKNRLPIFLKMINYLKNDSKKELVIYLILTNLKKECIDNEDISSKHINSGYTDFSKNIIFIWREEEFEKVTFHELIHFFDKDHRDEKYELEENVDLNKKRYYESLTDTKAIYYNIIYISLLTKIKLKILLNLEINFLNNQAMYIINHLKFNIKEISPATAYFIIKAKIFNYLISDEIDYNIFNDIFINHINGKYLLKKIFNSKLNNINYNNFNSARMSFFELD